MDTRWLLGQELNPYAKFRLFCLPYAGGGASVYRTWRDLVPSHIQVCALELPGRGSRMREAPFMRMNPLVRSLVSSLGDALNRPFALFGHSMGGLVAFELARSLRERGRPQPAHLFVSATAAPGTRPRDALIHCASSADVKKRLRTLNGTPRQLLENDELMELMLPTLRADFSVLETYEYRDQPPLEVPITVFGGTSDQAVPPAALHGWRKQSVKGSRLQLFPGDHFFLHSAVTDVMGAITHALG